MPRRELIAIPAPDAFLYHMEQLRMRLLGNGRRRVRDSNSVRLLKYMGGEDQWARVYHNPAIPFESTEVVWDLKENFILLVGARGTLEYVLVPNDWPEFYTAHHFEPRTKWI